MPTVHTEMQRISNILGSINTWTILKKRRKTQM